MSYLSKNHSKSILEFSVTYVIFISLSNGYLLSAINLFDKFNVVECPLLNIRESCTSKRELRIAATLNKFTAINSGPARFSVFSVWLYVIRSNERTSS